MAIDKKKLKEEMYGLLSDSVKLLRKKVKAGELDKAEWKAIVELCKQNSIDVEIREGNPLDSVITDDLPFMEAIMPPGVARQ